MEVSDGDMLLHWNILHFILSFLWNSSNEDIYSHFLSTLHIKRSSNSWDLLKYEASLSGRSPRAIVGELGCGGGVQYGVFSQRCGGAVLVSSGTLYAAPRGSTSSPAATRASLTRPSSVGGEKNVSRDELGRSRYGHTFDERSFITSSWWRWQLPLLDCLLRCGNAIHNSVLYNTCWKCFKNMFM